ncbi:MAG: VanW family protein, partial [Clostridia bacterium]|nr:VanW family protein [Clostridia bacterium]
MEMELFPKVTPKKKRKTNVRVQYKTLILLGSALLILAASFGAYHIIIQRREARALAAQQAAEEERLRQEALLESAYQEQLATNTFFEGISVDGVDLSGMTMEEARAALVPSALAYQPTGTLQIKYDGQAYPVDLSTIGVSLDTEATLAGAFQLGRKGSYQEAKEDLDHLKLNGHNFILTPTFDYSPISARVQEIAGLVDRPMTNAAIQFSEDASAETPYTITDEIKGVILDQQTLVRLITEAVQKGTLTPIEAPVTEIAPMVTRSYLEASYTLRASAETSFKGSDSNRIHNIKKGTALINGTVLKPGDVFSANDVLGVRTSKNGWKDAGAYVGGAVDKQPGGGVCQLSSTLYNAAVKADLEIVYRRNHSMPVSYIKNGLDATINSVGNIIDFKFKNNTSADILIRGVISGKNVRFEIYGLPFATTEYDEIKLSSKKTKTIEPEGPILETLDVTLAPGTQEVKVARQDGSLWQSYKNYYLNGELVKSEKLATSTYEAFAGEILIGP